MNRQIYVSQWYYLILYSSIKKGGYFYLANLQNNYTKYAPGFCLHFFFTLLLFSSFCFSPFIFLLFSLPLLHTPPLLWFLLPPPPFLLSLLIFFSLFLFLLFFCDNGDDYSYFYFFNSFFHLSFSLSSSSSSPSSFLPPLLTIFCLLLYFRSPATDLSVPTNPIFLPLPLPSPRSPPLQSLHHKEIKHLSSLTPSRPPQRLLKQPF